MVGWNRSVNSLLRQRIGASGCVKPLRAEIWEFDLNAKRGREQKGVRPCLVVSSDALNRSNFGNVIIAGPPGSQTCPNRRTALTSTGVQRGPHQAPNQLLFEAV
jgi:mRNA-degrading endonuclease toxin of MazEF toxin-antitoxin module